MATGYAFFITGPNNPNFLGSFQDISNGFAAAISGTPNSLEFGLWIGSGLRLRLLSYEIGTTAFGTDLGSGTVALNGSNSTFLFINGFGYDVYDITIPVTSAAMTAGNTYWLSLSNANDATTLGTGSTRCTERRRRRFLATCNFRQNGTNFGGWDSAGKPSR